MTEDERREYFRRNQKVVVNKAQKGKMRFLQKYFHRGVYYLVCRLIKEFGISEATVLLTSVFTDTDTYQ